MLLHNIFDFSSVVTVPIAFALQQYPARQYKIRSVPRDKGEIDRKEEVIVKALSKRSSKEGANHANTAEEDSWEQDEL